MSHRAIAMPPLPDYYEILQVHPKASPAVIKKAYRTLLLELGHHPDQGGDPAVAALITEAYEVLGDPVRRSEYDRAYFKPPAAGPAAGASARPTPGSGPIPPSAAGQAAAGPASSLIVLCPGCRTKNRVRSQDVLDIAKCSKCGQKLSRLPNVFQEWAERVRSEARRACASVREAIQEVQTERRTGKRAPKGPPASPLLTVGVPLLLLAVSASVIVWAMAGDPLLGDPIQAANRLEQQDRFDDARLVLRHAIDQDPANPRLHEKLGETSLAQKDYVEAARHFQQAADLNPDNAYLLAQQGRALYLGDRLAEAEIAYKAALRIDPNYDPALFDLGNIFAKRQRFDDAARYYERALTLRKSEDLYYNLGLVRKQADQPDAAIEAFKAALRVNPNHRASMVQLAELFTAKGQFGLAAAQLVTASALRHEDVDLHLKLATLYERTGQTGLAIREWTTCMEQAKDQPLIVERARRALTKLGAPPSS